MLSAIVKMINSKQFLIIFTSIIILFYLIQIPRMRLIDSLNVNNDTYIVSENKYPTHHSKSETLRNSKADENDTSCYYKAADFNETEELDNLIKGKEVPNLGRNIFFHETSCFGEEGFYLNSRQACAVESAAKMNPNMNVYLLHLDSSKISKSAEILIEQLKSYENIKIKRISMDEYVKKTPLKKWYKTGILKTSLWPRAHISDILRYLTLWKYAGIYLDLDVVVISSLENLDNFACAESKNFVAAGALGFGMDELGRGLAASCLKNLKRNFRGNVWGNNGPGVITRVLQKFCDTKSALNMTLVDCNGFNILPPSAFYPISTKNWTQYFEAEISDETMSIIEDAKAIHVWNKLSHNRIIHVKDTVLYTVMAKKYCPKVFSNCGDYF